MKFLNLILALLLCTSVAFTIQNTNAETNTTTTDIEEELEKTEETLEEKEEMSQESETEHHTNESESTLSPHNATEELPLTINTTNKTFEYIPLEEVIGTNKTTNETTTPQENKTEQEEIEKESDEKELSEEKEDEEETEEKIPQRRDKNGRIELELEAFENDTIIHEISKKELQRSETKKEIIISSDSHYDSWVKVYSDLPSEAQKDEIIITWENENEIVSHKHIEYFDEDGNGLIERVSWIVPHLSTQYYTIELLLSDTGDSATLTITDIFSPVEGTIVSNPILFDLGISYVNLSAVTCDLLIDGSTAAFSQENGSTITLVDPLSEGSHTWNAWCYDENTPSNNDSASGIFLVSDLFSFDVETFFFGEEHISGTVIANGGVVELWIQKQGGTKQFVTNLSDTVEPFSEDFTISDSFISGTGIYTLYAYSHYFSEVAEISQDVYLGGVEVDYDGPAATEEEFEFKITTDTSKAGTYDLLVGDTLIANNIGFAIDDAYVTYADFVPETTGTFDVTLEFVISGKAYTVPAGSLTIQEGGDTSDPDITLLFPGWEEVVYDSEIDFRYRASDNGEIASCSFELYNTTKDGSGVYEADELLFPLTSSDESLTIETNIIDDKEIEIQLIEFDEGDYVWEVTCTDLDGNDGWDFNYFSVDLGGEGVASTPSEELQAGDGEIADLVDTLTTFIEGESSLGPEEKKVLEILGLSEEMGLHKKRLLQMDQDLSYNLKFLDEEKKDQRIEEIAREIEEIKENILVSIDVRDSYEFSKNSLSVDLEEVIQNYLDAKNTNVGRSTIKSLAKVNKELQNDLTVQVEAWDVKLEYLEEEKEITLVRKKLVAKSSFGAEILEVIPTGLEEKIILVSTGEKVSSDIYSIPLEDLEEGELIYYFESSLDLATLEDTESILFRESAIETSPITGFFVSVGDGFSSFSWFFFIGMLFLGYAGFFVFEKIKINNWKKDSGVSHMLDLINDTRTLIRRNDIEGARTNYSQMKEAYKLLPTQCKNHFYKEIEKIRLAIDKKDVLNLIKEYEAAKDSFRKEDALRLHTRIREIYRKLPKRFQERVYQRLIQKEI